MPALYMPNPSQPPGSAMKWTHPSKVLASKAPISASSYNIRRKRDQHRLQRLRLDYLREYHAKQGGHLRFEMLPADSNPDQAQVARLEVKYGQTSMVDTDRAD
jgi:hypothetical protein